MPLWSLANGEGGCIRETVSVLDVTERGESLHCSSVCHYSTRFGVANAQETRFLSSVFHCVEVSLGCCSCGGDELVRLTEIVSVERFFLGTFLSLQRPLSNVY